MTPSEDLSTPSLVSISPILPVRNMPLSVAFYQRLGFQSSPYQDGSEYAFLWMDRLSIHLTRSNSPDLINSGGVYLYVVSVDEFFRKVKAAGIQCLHPPQNKPWGLREFAVSDPDETLLRFGQRLGPA